MSANLAEVVAGHLSAFRAGYGTSITWKGGSYAARIVEPQRRQFEFLAEGLGINIADADVRYIMLTPSDFVGALYPVEGDTIALPDEPAGTFQVLRGWLRAISGVPHTLQLLVYRQALPDASTTASGTEPGTGLRKQYWPASSS